MPLPKMLNELQTPEEALEFFGVVCQNLPGELIQRIKDGQVAADERAGSPKLEAACKAWSHYRSFTGTVIADGYSVMHARA